MSVFQYKQQLCFFCWRPTGWPALTCSIQRRKKKNWEAASWISQQLLWHFTGSVWTHTRLFVLKFKWTNVCSAMQMCVLIMPQLSVCLFTLSRFSRLYCDCDFFFLLFCMRAGVYLSQVWLGLHRGGYRRLQVSCTSSFDCFNWHVVTPALSVLSGVCK